MRKSYTATLQEHREFISRFEEVFCISPTEQWDSATGELFETFVCVAYDIPSFDDYHVDTEPCYGEYEHDFLTLGHDF